MNLDFKKIIASLSLWRPIFHSEDDLKFSLAWTIKKEYDDLEVRLEKRMKNEDNKRGEYIDMFLKDHKGERIGIEFKYFTAKLNCFYQDEEYSLTKHSANILRSYDCWKDVSRLERFAAKDEIDFGYTFWLTNDKSYWNEHKQNTKSGYDQFKIYENRQASGELKWNDGMGENTVKGRGGVSLKNTYTVRWDDYSNLEKCIYSNRSKHNIFRYVLLEVPPDRLSK